MVAFNRAIAKGYSEGPEAGISALIDVEGMETSHYYHTALGDFYFQSGELAKAQKAYEIALQFTALQAERNIIQGKLRLI